MIKKEKEIDGVDNDIELSDIQDIVKNFGLGAYAGDDERLKVQFIPFGIPGLDTILGGGLPRNRFTMFGGDTAVGKSFLSQKLIANAQKLGCSAVYFNVENKYDPAWFTVSGVDIKKLIVVQGNIMESVWDSMIAFAEKGVDLVVLDSLAALVPSVMEEAAMADQASYTGKHAYMVAKGFQKIMPALSMSDRKVKTAFLFLNQIRENIRMSPFAGGGDVIYPGGKSIEHYCSIKARVRRGEWDQETKKDVTTRRGFQLVIRTEKNQVHRPFMEATIPFPLRGK
jgi:protein RecA